MNLYRLEKTLTKKRQELETALALMEEDSSFEILNEGLFLSKEKGNYYIRNARKHYINPYPDVYKTIMDNLGGRVKDTGGYYHDYVLEIDTLDPVVLCNQLLAKEYVLKIKKDLDPYIQLLVVLYKGNWVNEKGAFFDIPKATNEDIKYITELLLKYKIEMADSKLDFYINTEKECIGITPYDRAMLTNPNQGHWDITGEQEIEKVKCFGKDPHDDIQKGVVGIDFGTKSTIVYYQDENSNSLPMPVGAGTKELQSNRYENPTIMEFCSISNFMQAYKEKEGRPETKWKDILISSKAKEDYKEAGNDEFNAYVDNLKQWASGRGKNIKVMPKSENGNVYELKNFLDLGEDDINPIEIYAYLIGRFVNNMKLGVHLNYYLSVPVKFEQKVRDKLRESFEKGLKKSLPVAILNDSNTMKRFKVTAEVTEPLAYAVCALQEYEIDPSKGDVNYAVFDFGGGTVDYDFGKWTNPDKPDKYDYKIETFGGDGMAQMGGENLLEDLATKIFKDNLKNLIVSEDNGKRVKKYQFRLGPTSEKFPEYDVFVSDSVEADKNMHILINGDPQNDRKGLRDYWENSEELLINPSSAEQEISFDNLLFYDSEGDRGSIALKTTRATIEEFFKNKISEAIRNFIEALKSPNNEFNPTSEIKIFLAGNSCKSPYVKELFETLMEETQLGCGYELYPPLGTNEAKEKMVELNLNPSDKEERPTGKTGVAYGLIECRRGGNVQINKSVIQEDKFEFYIGRNSKKKFAMWGAIQEGKPNFNEWIQLVDVEPGDDNVELYYTNLPECLNGELAIEKSRKGTCEFEEYAGDDTSCFFIRAVGPHTVEYTVSSQAPQEKYKGKIYKLELSNGN